MSRRVVAIAARALTLSSLALLAVASRRAEAWETTVQGVPTGGNRVQDVAILPNGDVAAAGSIHCSACNGQDWLIARFDGVTGATVWTVTIAGGSGAVGSDDEANCIASDTNGDIFVEGAILASDDSGYRAGIVKLNGLTGAQLWGTLLTNAGASSGFKTTSLVVDSSGNPVASVPSNVDSNTDEFSVFKLDGTTGQVLWNYVQTTAHTGPLGTPAARGVALDGSDDVIAVGSIQGTASSQFSAVKLSGLMGTEIWRQTLTPGAPGSAAASTVALEPNGDVIVGGGLENYPQDHQIATVAKFAGADGTILWTRQLPQTFSVNRFVYTLAVNTSGRIFAGHPDDALWIVTAVDPLDGSVIWSKNSSLVCDPFYYRGAPLAARTLSNGDVVVAGDLLTLGGEYGSCLDGYEDVVGIRYSAVDGSEVWRSRQLYAAMIMQAVAVTTDDDVVVAGWISIPAQSIVDNPAVIRMNGADGQFAIATPTPTLSPTPAPSQTPTRTPTPIATATPDPSGCCSDHAGGGCTTTFCANEMCGRDPYCCNTAWDQVCVVQTAVTQACPICGPQPVCLDGSTDPADCKDSFVCYKVKASKGSTPFMPGDFWHPLIERDGLNIRHPLAKTADLCGPAHESSSTVLDPAMHYEIHKSKINAFSGNISDQFGTWSVGGSTSSIMVPTYTMLDADASQPPAGSSDTYECVKAEFGQKFPKGIQVTVTDEFETARVYDVKKPKALCHPTYEPGGRFVNPQLLIMCYQIKLAKGQPKHVPVVGRIHAATLFGDEQLDTSKQDLYCVPAKPVP